MESKDQFKPNALIRYSFHGKSSTLITNISIIGYEKNNLNKLIVKRQQDDLFNQSLESNMSAPFLNTKIQCVMDRSVNLNELQKEEDQIIVDEAPIVLYDQSSNYSQGSIDNDTIISMIYPNKPKIYIHHKKDQVKINEKISHVIFSFKYSNEEDNDIRSLHYFTFTYYDLELIGSTEYYCPFAICILSEYPFFDSFKQLADELRTIISSSDIIPKEYVLFNIVNYIPAPINTSISICLYRNTKMKSNDKGNQKSQVCFNQLSGFPMFQFDIYDMFQVFSLEEVIEAFVYSFLEVDLVFFSDDVEMMNIIMFIIANMNYPFSVSDYFQRIGAISLEMHQRELEEEFNSNINQDKHNKSSTRMSGVNLHFSTSLYDKAKKKEAFIIELDKHYNHFHYNCNTQARQEEINQKAIIFNYIRSCIKEKKSQDALFAISINNLYQNLKEILLKYPQSKPSSSLFFKKQNNKETIQMNAINKQIQEAFYSFIVNIMSNFVKEFTVQLPAESNSIFTIDNLTLNNHHSSEKKSKEERILYDIFKQTEKFNLFILNFIQKKNNALNFNIPLLFLEEYCYQKLSNIKNNINPSIQYFNAIDDYYDIDSNYYIFLDFNQFDNNVSQVIIDQLATTSSIDDNNANEKNNNNYKDKDKDKDKGKGKDDNYLYFQNRFDLLKVIKSKKKIGKIPSAYLLNYDNYINYFNYIDNLTEDEINILFPIKSYTITSGEIMQSRILSIDSNTLSYKKQSNAKLLYDRFKTIKSNLKVNQFIKCSQNKIYDFIEEELIIQKIINQNETILCSFIIFLLVTKQFSINSCSDTNDLIHYILYIKREAYFIKRLVHMLVVYNCKEIQIKIDNNKDYLIEWKCLSRLIALVIKINMIPNKELSDYLNWSINKRIVSIEDLNTNLNRDFKFSQYEFVVRDAKNKKEVIQRGKTKNFLRYNLAQDKKRKYPDYFLSLADITPQYCGNYNVHISTQLVPKPQQGQGPVILKEKMKTNWVVLTQLKHYPTILYSPLKIYRKCRQLIDMQNNELINQGPDYELLRALCCNFIFYIENTANILQINDESADNIELSKDHLLDVLYSILIHMEKNTH